MQKQFLHVTIYLRQIFPIYGDRRFSPAISSAILKDYIFSLSASASLSMLTQQQLWSAVMHISLVTVLAVTIAFAFQFGSGVLLLLLPIAVFGFIANRMFKRAVGMSQDKAAQASRHVEELSHYLAEQERTRLAIQKSEEKFRNAFDHASIGMALVSMSGGIMKVNRAFAKLLGFTQSELLSRDFTSLLPEDEVDLHKRELTRLFYGAVQSTQIEQRVFHKNQEIIWVLWNASINLGDLDEEAHYIFQFQDITDKKRAEERIVHDALHDGLTGLPNRMLFVDRLQVAFRRAQRGFNINFAVCYLDFDRFKLVNDSYGHAAGDKLLVEMAARLKSLLRTSDTVARLGGDEFAVLIEEIVELDEIVPTLERIQEEIAKPFEIDSKPVYSTVSIGVAPWTRQYERPDVLLRDADTALYQAKRAGRNRYEFFSEEMHASTVQHLQNETDLRDAVAYNQFRAFYQPIVHIETGVLAGFEALIRWDHPRRGLVSPAEFIPVAEESDLIFPIGEWMLRESCRQLAAWRVTHPSARDIWMSVNVSAKQFMHVDLVSLVRDVLAESGLPPGLLKLELTETAMAENLDHVVSIMHRLKEIGVRLSIDDFGTGYSSLSSLHKLPLDSLKIDRAFVVQMNSDGESDDIIRTIISLARSLNLEVIAEGLETPEQLEHLRLLKCQLGQGYYFSRPLDAADAENFASGRQGPQHRHGFAEHIQSISVEGEAAV